MKARAMDFRLGHLSATVHQWHVIVRTKARVWHLRPPSDLPLFSEREGVTPTRRLPFGWRVTMHDKQ